MSSIKGLSKVVAPKSATAEQRSARQARASAARSARIAAAQDELAAGTSKAGKKLSAMAIIDRVFYLARFGIVGVPGNKFHWNKGCGMICEAAEKANAKPGARLPPIDMAIVDQAFGFPTEDAS